MLILLAAVAAVLLLTHGSSVPLATAHPDPWVGLLVLIATPAVGWAAGRLVRAQLRANGAFDASCTTPSRGVGARAAQRALLLTLGPVLAIFAISVLELEWVAIAKSWVTPRVPLATHLIALAPFWLAASLGLIALSGAWSTREAVAYPRAAARALVRSDLRLLAAPLVPFLFFMTVLDAGWYLPRLQELLATNPFAAAAALFFLMLAVLILAPFGVRFLWPSRSLPAGPLRDRLVEIAREARLGFRDIRVWETGPRGVINACITGVFPRFRYVIFTDALLAQLDAREIEGVFAHELGHVRHRHFTIYFAAVVAFFFAYQAFASYLPSNPFLELLLIATVGYAYFGGWFGILSRHYELESDRYGAQLLGSPGPLASALERIGYLTRTTHRKRGWRHPSIPERVAALWHLDQDPAAAVRFATKTRRFHGAVAACFVFGAAAYGLDLTQTAARPQFTRTREVASFLLHEYRESALRPGRDVSREQVLLERARALLDRSEQVLRAQPDLASERRATLLQLATVHELLGNPTEAFLTRQRARLLES